MTMEQFKPVIDDVKLVLADGNEFEKAEKYAAFISLFLNNLLGQIGHSNGATFTSFQQTPMPPEVSGKLKKNAQVFASIVSHDYRDRPDLLEKFLSEVRHVLFECRKDNALTASTAGPYLQEIMSSLGNQILANNRRSIALRGQIHEFGKI
jgi:hypothetical protein